MAERVFQAPSEITKIAGAAGTELRDRSRSVKLKVLEIARAARAKGRQSQEKLKSAYGKLLHATSRAVGQAGRFAEEIASGVKRSRSLLKQMASSACAKSSRPWFRSSSR
jgi:IS5 family transposase